MFLALLIIYVFIPSIHPASTVIDEASSSGTYYVRTEDTNSSCPVTNDATHCQTLGYYAENKSFENNRTFVFLSGTHTLTQEVIVEGKERLSLLGTQKVCRIICTDSSAGFAFFDTVHLQISNLEFHKCSIQKQGNNGVAAALIIKNSFNTFLDGLVVTNTSGGSGLRTFNTRGILSITNSLFAYNMYDSHWEGGNVKIFFSACDDSTEPMYVLIKNAQFLYGSEYYRVIETIGGGGLTIVFSCYNVKVHIEDSVLNYNLGYFGANLDLIFTLFTNNSVTMNNVTSCYGYSESSRGAGLFINILENIGYMDEFSCDRQKHIAEENILLNFTRLLIHGNNGSGFNMEDRSYPNTDCVAQYAFIKDSVFSGNTGPMWWGGTAVRFAFIPTSHILAPFSLIFTTFKNCSFHGHHTTGQRFYDVSVLYFELVKKVTIEDCSIGNNSMTGIQAYTSNIHFKGSTIIFENTNSYGAGLLLLQNSFMFLSEGTHIDFYNNHALTVGGALFTDFDFQTPTECPCFYQLDISGDHDNDGVVNSIKVYFHNNTAGFAGSAIFGGVVSGCLPYRHSSVGFFESVFQIHNTVDDPSAITSDPYFVCFCFRESQLPNCSVLTYNVSVFPGDNFQILAATVGSSESGTIPGVVHSRFITNYPNTTFGSLQGAQNSGGKSCTNLNFTIYSLEKKISFSVLTDKLAFFSRRVFQSHIVNVWLLACPPGFELHHSGGRPECNCEKQLQVDKSIRCLITSQVIVPPVGSWVGYYKSSSMSGAIFHRYCPYYYCHSEQTYISLNNTNMQCSSNRSGILCGECQEGLSLMLGRNQCAKCSYVSLLFIVVFAFMGVVLVVFLFALRLTVSEGTINGLIFYVNVLKMNQSLLLPGNKVNFLSVFIAWMNLDLGIDLCFYDGMDSISKTFLQFAFPAYIWLLVILVILMANRYRFIANIVGQRAVQVLSTLLLLSYTKLQRVIVTIITYTTLVYPDSSVQTVWLFDGNIRYLQGKHISLLTAGIVCFLLFIFPYTVLLTCFKYIQAHSDKKLLSWINRLKPVIDAYAGPYKDNLRFWTGFLLLSRTVLLFALTLNQTASPDYNLYAAVLVAIILLMIVSSVGGIYKYWLYNLLESSSYFNTAAVALSLLYSKHNQYAILNASMGVSFSIFLVVVLIHLFKYTPLKGFLNCIRNRRNNERVNYNEQNEEDLLFERHEDDGDI